MTERTLAHATLIMERTYNAAPARVFAAWESVEARKRWSPPTPGTRVEFDEADFHEGGRDVSRCVEPNTTDYVARVHYLDIRADQRIVFAESVGQGERRLSAALISVELTPAGAGTHLLLTMQIASFEGARMEEGYQFGWSAALDNLAREFS